VVGIGRSLGFSLVHRAGLHGAARGIRRLARADVPLRSVTGASYATAGRSTCLGLVDLFCRWTFSRKNTGRLVEMLNPISLTGRHERFTLEVLDGTTHNNGVVSTPSQNRSYQYGMSLTEASGAARQLGIAVPRLQQCFRYHQLPFGSVCSLLPRQPLAVIAVPSRCPAPDR
jgi:hypothetical protein